MYSRTQTFSKCEYYCSAELIESKEKSNLEISTYSMNSKYNPIDELQKIYKFLPVYDNPIYNASINYWMYNV